ncbi:MAG: SDR family oxidoreductase [Clostridia bacterium]|nr:SDR family oxidoreductase [Clostridia bacterium]
MAKVKELFDLHDQVAIVTGGGRGLGLQMAEALADQGCNVVLCSRKIENCQAAAEEIASAYGVKALALACNVRAKEDVDRTVRETLDNFGRIDILVNNAGASWGAPIEEMTLEQWNKVQETNVTGTFLFCQAVGPIMKKQGKGKIINIASVAGLYGLPPEIMNAVGYHASKGAVIAMTRDLAVKWGRFSINVNAIAPGFFPTKMSRVIIEEAMKSGFLAMAIPLGRLGGDDDLKGAIVYLASRASDYMTGQVMIIDGGTSAM